MRIAIEPDLTNVKDYLEDQGYECIILDDSNGTNLNIFDAIVTTGLDNTVMGYADTDTDAIIIEADGMTPEEIYEEIQEIE